MVKFAKYGYKNDLYFFLNSKILVRFWQYLLIVKLLPFLRCTNQDDIKLNRTKKWNIVHRFSRLYFASWIFFLKNNVKKINVNLQKTVQRGISIFHYFISSWSLRKIPHCATHFFWYITFRLIWTYLSIFYIWKYRTGTGHRQYSSSSLEQAGRSEIQTLS